MDLSKSSFSTSSANYSNISCKTEIAKCTSIKV